MSHERILNALRSMPWMMLPEKLEAFVELVLLRMQGERLTTEEVAERTDHPRKGESRDTVYYVIDDFAEVEGRSQAGTNGAPGHVAVIPIYGVIMHRPMEGLSSGGGFNLQQFQSRFRAAMGNPNVSAIVLDVDSPGGSVDGVEEMSQEIYRARGKKKIVAVANTLAASAAYYLASSAEELAVTPSGEVGSIGVYVLHQDMTGAYEQKGVKNTLIKAGKYKAEGNPWSPLDGDSMAALQSKVDGHYAMFTRAVGRNRNVSVDAVRNGFGEGRTVMAKEAVRLGMADKVATLDEVLKSLGAKGSKSSNVSSEAETLDIQAGSAGDGLSPEQRQRELDMF